MTDPHAGHWWQKHPGKWSPQLEDALASGEPRRIGLAWAIIYVSEGKRGSPGQLAELCDLPVKTIQNALAGSQPVSRRVEERVLETTKLRHDLFSIGAHVFSVSLPIGNAEPIDPEDETWEASWATLRLSDSNMPTAEQLRASHSSLFR